MTLLLAVAINFHSEGIFLQTNQVC